MHLVCESAAFLSLIVACFVFGRRFSRSGDRKWSTFSRAAGILFALALAMGPGNTLAPVLRTQFTTFTYDRRGRGDSGDTRPYGVAREVEDIAALMEEAVAWCTQKGCADIDARALPGDRATKQRLEAAGFTARPRRARIFRIVSRRYFAKWFLRS